MLDGDEVVFPAGNDPAQVVGFFHVLFVGKFFEDGFAVLCVEDAEILFVAEAFGFAFDDIQAKGVEGGNGESFGFFLSQELRGAFAHFTGGFVGEGDRGDLVGRMHAFADHPRDFLGDDAGFATASACEDEEGRAEVGNGGLLLGVESVHVIGIRGLAKW